MIQQFVNREVELAFLEGKYREDAPQLVVLYGKRRAGKTELIKRFMQKKEGTYMLCTNDSIEENIKEAKRKFYGLTGKDYFLKLENPSFFDLFKYLSEEIGEKKAVIAIDEFPYLIELNKGVVSVFQKIWDELLAHKKLFLIICGSSVGMMETEVLDYKSPLYGRRTGDWKVEPMRFRHVKSFLRNYDAPELVKAWAVCGGMPFYLSKMDGSLTVEENIKEKILKKGEVLYNEPRVLLKEEFREPRTYTLILKYLSLGYNTQGKLASATGIEKGNLSKYLSVLEEVRIIEHILPLGQRKRGIYEINDQFFSFWFRFAYPNQSDLELGLVRETYAKIAQQLNAYYGKAFERLIAEQIRLKEIKLPFSFTEVRRWWHNENEIDLIALNSDTKEILLGECKWQEKVNAEEVLRKLNEKTGYVSWHNQERKETLAVFARSFSKKITEYGGKPAICVDLKDMERQAKEQAESAEA